VSSFFKSLEYTLLGRTKIPRSLVYSFLDPFLHIGMITSLLSYLTQTGDLPGISSLYWKIFQDCILNLPPWELPTFTLQWAAYLKKIRLCSEVMPGSHCCISSSTQFASWVFASIPTPTSANFVGPMPVYKSFHTTSISAVLEPRRLVDEIPTTFRECRLASSIAIFRW